MLGKEQCWADIWTIWISDSDIILDIWGDIPTVKSHNFEIWS